MIAEKRIHMTIKGDDKIKHSKNDLVTTASELGLTGEVKSTENLIEIVAEGKRESVWGFIKKITTNGVSITFEEVKFHFTTPKDEFNGFRLA